MEGRDSGSRGSGGRARETSRIPNPLLSMRCLSLQAVFKIVGSTTKFPRTKKEYVDWGDEIEGNDGSSCGRFLGGAEPYGERLTLHEPEEPGEQQA